jgi:hypothetical protein
LRCQRITVAGCTIAKAIRHSGHTPASTTQRPIRAADLRTFRVASQDGQLLSQSQVLQRQLASRLEARPRR